MANKFFRQIGNGFKKFGRQLQKGAQSFGKQLQGVAGTVSHGIGSARSFISNLEKKVGDIPIVGTGLKLLNSGLGVAQGVADVGSAGGRALTAASSGDWSGAQQAGKDALQAVKDTGGLGTQFLGQAAPVLAMM